MLIYFISKINWFPNDVISQKKEETEFPLFDIYILCRV